MHTGNRSHLRKPTVSQTPLAVRALELARPRKRTNRARRREQPVVKTVE